jgi:hypothetical protein
MIGEVQIEYGPAPGRPDEHDRIRRRRRGFLQRFFFCSGFFVDELPVTPFPFCW